MNNTALVSCMIEDDITVTSTDKFTNEPGGMRLNNTASQSHHRKIEEEAKEIKTKMFSLGCFDSTQSAVICNYSIEIHS